jgi:predicted nucleic acid-binding Zn ribbon protein
MTEDPVYNCPVCGAEMKRLIGAGAGPLFKGTGFYQTDYKNKSTKPADKGSK